jgi:protein-S-isoprenylcysteine O-methyltransferase Ste14
MSIKILPVLQMLLFGLLMLVIKTLLPFAAFAFPAQNIISAFVAACGLILILAGGALFRKHATTVNPHKPDAVSSLVVNGIYRYTRNPMYLGFLLILAAWGVFIGNLINLTILPLFVTSMTVLNIKPEEQALTDKFGERYTAYASKVRRWL